jgi:transcriptional regulator with XRE-family HTH domain
MISPHVRRLRLATELRSLRTQAGLTHAQLSKRSGEPPVQISRLENGHSVDQASVMKILDALNVDGEKWTQIMTITREAGEKGWWESTKGMGDRQALYANLEAGATSIREYHMTFLPGLLQIPEFVRARWDADNRLRPVGFPIDGIVAGSAGRRRMLRRPGAPTYEVIVDEAAIRRLSAPPDVFKKQLHHLVEVVDGDPKLTLRVLPIDAPISGYAVPRCLFSIYTYADPGDPTVVACDLVTSDLVLTESADVIPYEELYTGLRQAAISEDDSLRLITKAATELPHT